MKKLFLSLWLIIPALSIASQGKPYSDSAKFPFRLNPIRLFEGTFAFNYEQRIASHWSLDITAMGTYGTKQGLSGAYLNVAMDDFTTKGTSYNTSMVMGWGVMAQPKHFLFSSKQTPVGAYAAPFAMFRRVSITGERYVGGFAPWSQMEEATRNLNIYAVGVMLGGKIPIAKVYCIDFYVGGAFRLSNYYGSEKTFTKYKRWKELDYSGVLPTAGISIGILR